MKYSPRLVSNVRALFGFLRGLTAACCVLLPFLAFIPGTTLSLKDLPFKAYATVTPKGSASAVQKAEIVDLRGQLQIHPTTAEDRRMFRYVLLIPGLLVMLSSFGIFHLIWRLCRNVENGEVFSLANVKLVRNAGVLLMAYSFMALVTGVWLGHYMLDYARDHFFFAGLELQPASKWVTLKLSTSLLQDEVNYFVIGLLVLCLAEVFRHGLALKQEAELTV